MSCDASRSVPPGGWPRPRAAYVHVPFCRHRCGYCNFAVVSGRDDLADRFLRAIDVELRDLGRPPVDTLFIGGGTPTHLPADRLRQLLDCVSDRLDLASDCEWSVEANPEDINDEKLALLTSAGVNRISLGVQSFDDRKLKMLERGHSGDGAADVISKVAASIENLSIDLIFAAPGESLDDWRSDLQRAISLPVAHLSTYALTFEKGTQFWNRRRRGQLQGATESLEVEMYKLTRAMVSSAGWNHYEISNFARDPFRCRHNLAYWQGRGWFAAGPGAARFVDGRREVNHRSTTTYLKRIESGQTPTAESESISTEQYARERAAFGVRMIDGIDLDLLAEETGIDLQRRCTAEIETAVRNGWIEIAGGRVKLTERGILFADSVAAEFLG